jgi:hypothetical protein
VAVPVVPFGLRMMANQYLHYDVHGKPRAGMQLQPDGRPEISVTGDSGNRLAFIQIGTMANRSLPS